MASGDYMNLTFRNTTTYQPDGSFIPDGYIFTVSSNGRQNWTNSLRLDSLTVSTFTLNSTFIVASTNTNNMVIFSTLTVSSTDSRNLTYSTLRGDTIVTNNLTLNSNLTVGSTFASLVQTSTLLASTLQSLNGTLSSLATAQLVASSIRTGAFFTQNATVASTLTTSTLHADNTSGRLASYDTLAVSTAAVSSLLTTSSLFVPGSVVYSTLSGSTLTTRLATVQSTLTVSTLLGSTLVASTLTSVQAEVTQLSVPSTAAISTAILQFANVSSLAGSTLVMRTVNFSTMAGSTLTLNTVTINSSLITSSFATGSLNFSTLVGSTVATNAVSINSTLTVSTTETQSLVVNRQPGTSANPAYKMLIDQGQGQNENALYITNSNYGSDQGLSIGMVNDGFSFFGSYAKIQGKRSGSAGTTNLVLQSDAGKVGIGTTNPDALVDIYAPSGVPATLFLYNGTSGTNSTGGDVTLSVLNMGSAGSGLYYDSIRIRVPNGAATSATRMDFCTPAGTTDNTQTTRLSILPYTGFIGVGTTVPLNLFTVYSATADSTRAPDGDSRSGQLIVTNSKSGSTPYTMAIGMDQVYGIGYLNAAGNGITQPICLNTRGGNVGIGTTTPGTKLTVYSTGASSYPSISIGSDQTSRSLGMTHLTSAGAGVNGSQLGDAMITVENTLGDGGKLYLCRTAASNAVMTVVNTGSVGIGTTSPIGRFHLDNGTTTGLAAYFYASGLGNNQNTSIAIGKAASTNNSGTILWNHVGDGSALNYVGIGAYGADNKLTVTAAGLIGVGTTAPSTTLHVETSSATVTSGVLSTRYFLRSPGDNQDGTGVNLDGPWYGMGWSGITGLSGLPYVCLAGYSGVAMRSSSGYIQLTQGGNVGIGTTNPGQRMTLMGLQAMDSSSASVNPELLYGAIRYGTPSVQNATSFALGLCGTTTAIDPYGRLDLIVNGYPSAGNTYGFTPDVKVMSVIGNGKVGIGTTDPIDTFDVNGTMRVVNRAIFPGFNNSGTTYYPGIINLGGGYGPQIRSVYPSGTYTDSISLQFLTNIAYNNSTLTPRMHIGAVTGYIGVNTTTPLARLTIRNGYSDGQDGGLCIDANDGNTYNLRLYSYVQGSSQVGYAFKVNNVSSSVDALQIGYNGNVGVGVTPSSKFHVKDGRMNLNVSRDPFTGLLAYTDANRAQFVLSSEYSDLVIGSSQINNLHGSTLTFASWNPNNSAEYRKWVINQGNWGSRLHMLEFGYADAGYTNPHSYIDGTSTVMTMDGINKRVGIGSTNPAYKLDVNGTVNSTAFRVGGDGGITFNGSSLCQIYTTPSDAYNPSSSANNMIIRSWWGIGFSDYANTVRITFNTRNGDAQFDGSMTVLGSVSASGGLWGRVNCGDLRWITNYFKPVSQPGGSVSFGFSDGGTTSFADTIHFNSYTDTSGGNQNYICFDKGTPGIRIWHGGYGSTTSYSTYRDAVMTNVNSSNVTISGSLGVNDLTVNGRNGLTEGYHDGTYNNYTQRNWDMLNQTNVFYKRDGNTKVLITGYATAWCIYNGGWLNIKIRLYHQATGTYYNTDSFIYTNIANNHTVIPINILIGGLSAGWYDVNTYWLNDTRTDSNDVLSLSFLIF